MESKVNYTVVGGFVVVLGAAFIVLFFWLSTLKQDKTYKTYLVYVHEEVTGLAIDSPVRYNGVPAGFVSKIELDPNNPQLVRIQLEIEEGTPITTSTVAVLRTQGITGIIYVGLKAETEHAPLLRAKAGEKYPVIPAKPSLLVQLSEVVPRLTTTVNDIGNNVRKLLSQKNREAIESTLQDMSTFTKMLSDNTKRLDAAAKALHATLANTATASKEFPMVMKKLDASLVSIESTAGAVKTTAKEFTHTAKQMNATLASGRSAMAGLSTQVMPNLQQAMVRLNNVMGNVQQITNDMTRNPSILVRGKVPEKPGPGES